MKDLIVSDNMIPNKSARFLTWGEFLDEASSDGGLDIEGDLYINTDGLEEDIYQAISDSIPSAIYFTTDGSAPEFLNNITVQDWSVQEDKPIIDNTPVGYDGIDNDPNIKQVGDSADVYDMADSSYEAKQARVMLFGSSKGGTGKTFTCLISAYRYAKMNPDKRVAVSDFDIIDGQVGITIHKINPTMLEYYKQFKFGKDDFETMERFKAKSHNFPPNLDFYLAPRDIYIDDDDFWDSIFINLIENYDTVFFDSGIDYMNYKPISTLYKIADKIILVSTTSIKSVSSVSKQIKRLKGEIANPVFTTDDGISDKLNLVITQAGKKDEMNSRVFEAFKSNIDIVGVFGVLTPLIQKAEYYGEWSIFDKNAKFNETIDRVVE